MYEPAFWIAISVSAYAAVTNLLWWMLADPLPFGLVAVRVGELRGSPEAAMWALVGQAAYFMGVPAIVIAARASGVSSAWGMRLVTKPAAIAEAVLLAIAVAALSLLIRALLVRAAGQHLAWTWRRPSAYGLGALVLAALAAETHWAFFRAGALSIGLRNPVAAVYAALAILALEAWANPWRRTAMNDAWYAERLSRGASLAILSATTFLLTASTPLCFAAHLIARGLGEMATPGAEEWPPVVAIGRPPPAGRRALEHE